MDLSGKLATLAKRSMPTGGSFEELIRGVGESRSKSEEDAVVLRMVEISKQQIREGLSRKDNTRALKELLVFLVYIDMLGHDTSWARATVIQLCSHKSLVVKKVGPSDQRHRDGAQRPARRTPRPRLLTPLPPHLPLPSAGRVPGHRPAGRPRQRP
jgi:hypothetical protein